MKAINAAIRAYEKRTGKANAETHCGTRPDA